MATVGLTTVSGRSAGLVTVTTRLPVFPTARTEHLIIPMAGQAEHSHTVSQETRMDFSKYEKHIKTKQPQISEENAFEQFNIFLDIHGIKLDKVKKYQDQCDFIIEAIMDGYLEFKDESDGFEIVQHLKRRSNNENAVEKLEYGELTQLDKQAMKKDSQEYKKITELFASMCKTNGGSLLIPKLKSYDAKVIESLGILFL